MSKITKVFDTRTVLTNISFTVMRSEKVALLGCNGIGKSTLLKIIMGQLAPTSGTYRWGFETHISYFAQEHHSMAYASCTLFDWLIEHAPGVATSVIRHALGAMLFSHDDVLKKVSILSGGEMTRLMCAKIMLEKGNVLVFDEPTNHLDIESRTALATALRTYPGTVLFVSHDRHFINHVATRTITLTAQGVQSDH